MYVYLIASQRDRRALIPDGPGISDHFCQWIAELASDMTWVLNASLQVSIKRG